MKRILFPAVLACVLNINLAAQVTQINSNKSLKMIFPLSATKTLLYSHADSTVWVTDGSLAGTKQLSAGIFYAETAGLLNGKIIFTGRSNAAGYELFISDGTEAGTTLLKDINPGGVSSDPGIDFVLMSGFIYFTARRPAEGRELWRTDGTPGGTTLVKDIRLGADDSNGPEDYHLFSAGSYLLFAARTPTAGIELWRSNGTDAGTVLLKDINTGHSNADSSNPGNFFLLGSNVLFTATDATHGEEIWKTDGTGPGTILLKDINSGTASSTSIEIFMGFSFPIFAGFHSFNNRAFFQAYDGASTGQVWSTDGTSANTTLLKDIVPATGFSIVVIGLTNATNLSGKFIFGVYDGEERSELWQSDGSSNGTTLFKAFSTQSSGPPLIFLNYVYDPNSNTISNPLFQGNKFFFGATTDVEGDELWISDGTLPNTKIVKDIRPNAESGLEGPSWAFNSTHFYFSANDGVKGIELWKTDGTLAGTLPVADINVGSEGSDPELFFFNANDNLLFGANNGDHFFETDLYVLGGGLPPAADPCPGTNIVLVSNITGASYQWQVSTGGAFSNLSNNASYSGVATNTLTIIAPPSSFYGYQYRCNVAGVFSSITTIKFVNRWTGAANNFWNNAGNWSCNVVPDANTDVVIDNGTPILNVNGACRTIKVSSGANFHANPGTTLQVLH
jgi:ELWxxDGT repeat protein